LQLLHNDQYYRGQPRLSALHVTIYQDEETAFKDFQQGKLDLLNAVPAAEVPGIRQSKDENLLLEKPVLETYCLGFNLQRDPYVRSYLCAGRSTTPSTGSKSSNKCRTEPIFPPKDSSLPDWQAITKTFMAIVMMPTKPANCSPKPDTLTGRDCPCLP
jgi:hypothetical protein